MDNKREPHPRQPILPASNGDTKRPTGTWNLTAAATAVALGMMLWLGATSDGWKGAYSLVGKKYDYYDLLVQGFMKGHLSMNAEVDPGLSSPDPGIRKNAHYLLDVSLYRGKYYLYFGVVPAVLLFLPYRALTGQDLGANIAVFLLVASGFLLYLAIFLGARRRFFRGLRGWPQACCILLLAFGSGTPTLSMGSGCYEVAIAGGYAFMALGWFAMFHAWVTDRKPGPWLALASLAVGLAVGSRPTYAFSLPILFLRMLALARRERRATGPWQAPRFGLVSAAVAPAGLVGLGLMAYNYQRFRNPFEFGFHYAMCELTYSGLPVAKPSFIWPNLKWYFLRPPAFSPFFPYVLPMNAETRPPDYYGYETIQGQLSMLLLAILCGAAMAGLLRRRAELPRRLMSFAGFVGGAFALLFLAVASFGFRANRYVPDFQGSLALLVVLVGGCCAASASWPPGPVLRPLWRTGFCILAMVSAAFNVLTSLEVSHHFEYMRPKAYWALAHWGDYPAQLLTRLGLMHFGPVRFEAAFRPVRAVTTGPLLSTGAPNATDVLYATQFPNNTVQLYVFHDGHGSSSVKSMSFEPGRPYQFEVDMGSLYPPRIGPWFRGMAPIDVEMLKTAVRVSVDGHEVIGSEMGFYDSPPNWVYIGKDPAGTSPPFSGNITSFDRLPPRDPKFFRPEEGTGVWFIDFEAPPQTEALSYPILGSGYTGHGNLLLLKVDANRRFQFGVDQWDLQISFSPTFAALEPGRHRLEVFAGPRVSLRKFPPASGIDPAKLAASASVFRVWLDGVAVWTTTITANRDSYGAVSVGANPQKFSTAIATYPYAMASHRYSAADAEAFIAKNL